MLNQVRFYTLWTLLLYQAIAGWHPFQLASRSRAPPSLRELRLQQEKPTLVGAEGDLMDEWHLQDAAADAGRARGAP